jgi:hypothetical protein
MHQYKTVAQILLILSIFNLVFAIPVVREIDHVHGDVVVPVAVPVAVRNVAATLAATSKERREDPDGTPSHSSPPPPDGSASSLPPPLDGSAPSLPPPAPGWSLSDGAAPLHESPPSPPGGPAASAVSPPPDRTASLPAVPASGRPVPSQHTAQAPDPAQAETEHQLENLKLLGRLANFNAAVLIIAGGVLWHYRHKKNQTSDD